MRTKRVRYAQRERNSPWLTLRDILENRIVCDRQPKWVRSILNDTNDERILGGELAIVDSFGGSSGHPVEVSHRLMTIG